MLEMLDKLAELILYIADKSQDDPAFGATKLNKILFLIDFNAYGAWGKSVSSAKYEHQNYGPVPSQLVNIRAKLISDGRAIIQKREYFGNTQDRIVAIDQPDISEFSDIERKLIDDAIDHVKHFNATELSDWTHKLLPWMVTENSEDIPYYAIFAFQKTPVSRAGLEWAQSQLKELRSRDAN